ncbi:helix-turn-helix transcriptional regulator [Agaribacterium haliotis]|uniref:helix-turn-helix transcriptional regulator n=1 Tax=Agaribacterium haliotis TaxID=2013869 RepID=UPI000BB59AE2|nr:AraC family transcriptional regulator [Agaribacterium haliotis]
MFNIPDIILNNVVLPLLSAQLFIIVALYFNFFGRHVLKALLSFNIFIGAYVFYLAANVLQFYARTPVDFSILYLRLTLILSLGLPCLTLFLIAQCQRTLPNTVKALPFFVGMAMSVLYTIGSDARHQQLLFDAKFANLIELNIFGPFHIDAEMFSVILTATLPSLLLLVLELRQERRKTCLAFIGGALIISLSYVAGLSSRRYWLYHVGASLTALYWLKTVYSDIQQNKSQTQLLKEQLKQQIQEQETELQPAIDQLLRAIEAESSNLQHYKLKIREILNELTELTIEAGGDADSLLERNLSKIESLLKSNDAATVRNIANQETSNLKDIITRLPQKRSETIIAETKAYIHQHFDQNIDIADLANNVHVSESYLMRCFKKHAGCTIKQYLTHYRIEQAKVLLTSMSVAEAAFAVGFNDSNYFSNVFKRFTGSSPQQYKNQRSA